ncbi:hypothetical protein CBR_g32021 [Chara braunii]|uniref:DDE Tnp4 domain-containing protein n=1 Tax=Chara braunii TaxID=69332 RepID=A0A388LGC0_CHABU|nr:hypothetical protein CBR_g32021 [Chara braunii]|eukprot:GBG81348.1 hypothetical protein CBR_g32021 [Chara braunii]
MDVSMSTTVADYWDDNEMFIVLFVIMQWINRRNVAAMGVLQAAATVSLFGSEISSVLFHLAGAVMHSVSLASCIPDELGARLDRRRRIWVIERSGGLWKDLQRVGVEHDKVFKRFCRLPRPVFNDVLARIGPHIQRQTTNWRQHVPVGQKFACALIRWATGGFYRQTAHGLGLGLCSGLRSNEDVADALIREYGNIISFPTGGRMEEVLVAFERKGFPGCMRAIDDTHIYLEKPKNERSECYGAVLRASPSGVRPRMPHIDGRYVGRYVLGDEGYPLLSWIMIPVGNKEGGRMAAEVTYDDCHTSARSCIERTFGRLKSVWRHFIRRQIGNMKTLLKEFMAISILHNIMVDARVIIDPDLLSDDSDDDRSDAESQPRRRRRVHAGGQPPQPPPPEEDPTYGGQLAGEIRESLISHVSNHARVHGGPPPNPWGR